MKLLRTLLRWLFNLVAVPVLLFEAWGLKPILALIDRFTRWPLWARIEAWVMGLSPYGALSLFVLPSLMLIPVKIAALYFLAAGQKLLGIGVLVAAKLVGTAIVARIFYLTRPKLMRIAWFARAYAVFERWRDHVLERLRNSAAWRMAKALKVQVALTVRPLVRWVRGWFRRPAKVEPPTGGPPVV